MYVYELAIQLGKRSTELSDAADQLGIGPLIAASELTPEQHARLVQHVTGQVVGFSAAAPGAAPLGGPPGAPSPMPSPSGGGRHVPWPVVVLGAVLAIGALVAGSYVLVGGQQDEFERQVDAQAAAEASGVIPESDPTDGGDAAPAPAPAGAPATTAPLEAATTVAPTAPQGADAQRRARCAASQKLADLDDQGDVLNTDAPTWEQFVWAADQVEAMLAPTGEAYAELRAVVPPDIQADIDVVWQATQEISRSLSAAATPEQLRPAVEQMQATALQMNPALMHLDAYVQDECDIVLAD